MRFTSQALLGLSNPSTLKWFNTAAFCSANSFASCVNPNGSSYGDAGRNIIEGPGQFIVNMVLDKTIQMSETRALDLRIQANNILNIPYFTGINTTVNSLTYGEVTSFEYEAGDNDCALPLLVEAERMRRNWRSLRQNRATV